MDYEAFEKFRLHIFNQTSDDNKRYLNPDDITLPPGYKIEVYAKGLDAPSGMTFSETGEIIVGESGYISGTANLLRLKDGNLELIAEGFAPPISGIAALDGIIYVANKGKITAVKSDGTKEDIIDGLSKQGDFFISNVVVGPDNKLYFAQGTTTNSGVVGIDNTWVYDTPFVHDIPGSYIMLEGQNFETQNIFSGNKNEKVYTGAFSPYGVPNLPYETRKGIKKASGAIMKANLDGTELDLVAWGFRYPVYLLFDRSNHLFVSNQSYESRGSRPIANAPNELYLVLPGRWYGWPDFAAGEPVTLDKYKPEGGFQPKFLLTNHPDIPQLPVAVFSPFSYLAGFDFNYNEQFGPVGDIYIAEFGSGGRIVPGVRSPYIGAGHRVSRVDMNTGLVTTFAMNKSGFPASITGGGGLERPVDVVFGPDGAMYVLDLGTNTPQNLSEYIPFTGVIWRITKTN